MKKEKGLKEKALQFIWDKGYGKGTNLTLNSVAYLMSEFVKQQVNGVDTSHLSFKEIGELADKWLEDEIALSVEDRFTDMEKYWMIEGFIQGYKKAQNGC